MLCAPAHRGWRRCTRQRWRQRGHPRLRGSAGLVSAPPKRSSKRQLCFPRRALRKRWMRPTGNWRPACGGGAEPVSAGGAGEARGRALMDLDTGFFLSPLAMVPLAPLPERPAGWSVSSCSRQARPQSLRKFWSLQLATTQACRTSTHLSRPCRTWWLLRVKEVGEVSSDRLRNSAQDISRVSALRRPRPNMHSGCVPARATSSRLSFMTSLCSSVEPPAGCVTRPALPTPGAARSARPAGLPAPG